MRRREAPRGGHTFVELLVTTAVLLVLASAALPIGAASLKREKEIRLRRALREIRLALDTYHAVCLVSTGRAAGGGTPETHVTIKIEDDKDLTCYPKDLDVLLEGVETNKPDYKLKFLRRIPRDPFNREDDEFDGHGWRFASTSDKADSDMWDRKNVFDVYSGSEGRALDGSFYEEW